jgi:hypothetical protein
MLKFDGQSTGLARTAAYDLTIHHQDDPHAQSAAAIGCNEG